MNATTIHQVQDAVSERVSSAISYIASALVDSCDRVTYEYLPAPVKSAVVGEVIASIDQVADQVPATDPVFAAKIAAFWQLLDTDLALVGSVLRMTPSWDGASLSDVHYDAAHARLSELLEQQVFRNPSTEPGAGMDLARFAVTANRPAASAVGWARQFLRSCAGSVIERTAPKAANSAFETEMDGTSTTGPLAGTSTSWTVSTTPSPEELVIAAAHEELRAAGRSDDQIFDSWHAAAHSPTGQVQVKRGAEKLHADAAALLECFVLPALCAPETAAERRSLLAAVTASPSLARRSLETVDDKDFSAKLTGNRDADAALLSLWDDFSADARARLLDLDSAVSALLIMAAVTLPAKPARPVVVAFSAAVRAAMPAADRDLIAAFIAEHRGQNLAFNHPDTHAQLLSAEAELAGQWAPRAAAVLETGTVPAGVSTVTDLAAWMENLLLAAA